MAERFDRVGPDDHDDHDGPGDRPAWAQHACSVRVRLTLAASLVTAVAVALAGWLMIRSVEDTQLGRLRVQAEESVGRAASVLESGGSMDAALAAAPEVSISGSQGACVTSTDVDGQVHKACTNGGSGGSTDMGNGIGGGAEPGGEIVLPPGRMLPIPGPGPGDVPLPGSDDSSASGRVARQTSGISADEIVSQEVEIEGGGIMTVTAVAPSDEVARSVEAVGKALWVLLPSLVGVVALVAWWLAGRALRPVEAIRVEAEEIGGTTIHRRLPEPGTDDEIGRLARTMNAMLDRLEHSARRQRQFVSDASHELRSPVAAIRTDLEVALHEGEQADWPTVASAVLAEEGRLETLLGDLLVLASDDETAAVGTHAAAVDMAQLAADEVARGRRVPVTLDRPPGADDDAFVVDGGTSRLERALANLVDNGARHAASSVRVSVSRVADRVRVVVDDDGPGVPAIDRERIFERFTRLDVSRARDRGGAGLGLAVVRSIVTRHGGYVWADDSPLGGARFTLELPAAR